MTRDEITRMAREAGIHKELVWDDTCHERVERFASLVAATKCEELADEAECNGNTILAQQIRARGEHE